MFSIIKWDIEPSHRVLKRCCIILSFLLSSVSEPLMTKCWLCESEKKEIKKQVRKAK